MKRAIFAFLLCGLMSMGLLMAQSVTTAAISGVIEVKTEGKTVALPGATITAVHTPTGTVTRTLSQDDGLFKIPSVRVGGPYTITVTCEGFRKEEVSDVYLKLGENRSFKFTLVLETINAGEVEVTASNSIISPERTGAGQNVTLDTIEAMPSISRTLDDLTRLAPQFDSDKENAGSFNAGGRNNRYNNIQIDGVQNNDIFGLGSSGTPGGQTGLPPISMDAIQEFQIAFAPFDVRQGGFTGGGVNVITRSGTNEFHGSAYFYGRNQALIGKGPSGNDYPNYSDFQMGFRLGGPILKDKLFFFVNGEYTRRRNPADYLIDNTGSPISFGQGNITTADADSFVNILKTKYNYDPGPYDSQYVRHNDSKKLFIRIDYNINDRHRLTISDNYVNPGIDVLYHSATLFRFPDNIYQINNRNNKVTAQLDSTFSDSFHNQLIVAYNRIRDERTSPSTPFPQITVYAKSTGSYQFRAGTEQYSAANSLAQDMVEFTDNLTWIKGKHTFILGTHNEFFKFKNLYIRDNYGTYNFTSLANLSIGKVSNWSYSFSNTSNPREAAEFPVQQIGFYAGDTWSMSPNFKLTYGLRMDVPLMSKKPTANPTVLANFGIPTNQTPGGNMQWSPRVGFNWDVNGDGKTQLRGGSGIFSGRAPYVWISNQYGNSGIEFTRYYLSGTSAPTFVADPFNQPKPGSGISANEIDLCDSDFIFPQAWRTNIGLDRQLPWGFVGTVDFIFTKNVKDVFYQNLNLAPTGKTLSDGRNLYGTVSGTTWTPTYKVKQYNDVIYLSNSSKGYQYHLTFQAQKMFSNGIMANTSYTYGKSFDALSGTSSQAISNWGYAPTDNDPNAQSVGYSNFDRRHRIVAAFEYKHAFLHDAPTTVGLIYVGKSGLPYSSEYSNDVNGDSRNNDLIYVPIDANDILLTTNNWADLDAYIKSVPALDKARGTRILRNASREPWNHDVDLRVLQDIPMPFLKGHKFQFTMTILNLLNLFNSNWGVYRYVSFNESYPLRFQGMDSTTGKPKFSFTTPTYNIDQLNSRWQLQFGARYTF